MPRFRSEAIQQLMDREGLTRTEFAERIGVSRQLVATWASGWVQPQFRTVLELCAEFDVDPSFFAEGLPEKPPPAEALPPAEARPKRGKTK